MSGISYRRGIRTATVIAVLVTAAAACVPTAPAPVELPRPPGTGIDTTVVSAPSAGCEAGGYGPGTSELTLAVDGLARRATLRIPEAHPEERPAPLLVSLHPFTMGSAPWESYSGLADAAVERGYVVLTPQGSRPGPRWAVPGGIDTGIDDIAFIDALVRHTENLACVNRNSEFAAGYSAGAAMAQALSCAMPWRFSAVAGSGGMNLTDPCAGSAPTDVLVLHGTADPIAPPTGSEVIFAPPLGLSIGSVAAANAARAGCDVSPRATRPVPGVDALVYEECDNDLRVEQWNMIGAGHTWAGAAPFPFDLVVGPTAGGFSANQVVLDFFDAA